MDSNTYLESAVQKNRSHLIPLMLLLYVLAFLDRSNIGFAKESYQLDTGLSDEAFALGAGIFFLVYAFLGTPCNLLMRKIGPKIWISATTVIWGLLSSAMALADTEGKFLAIRILLGIAEAGFFPGMIYLCAVWFPDKHRGGVTGLFYLGAPLALTLGAPLSGALLDMHGFLGHAGWFWMFLIEGAIAVLVGIFAYLYLDDTPEKARFLNSDEKAALVAELKSEEKHVEVSKFIDIFRNVKVWHFALIYFIIQMAVYGLVFFLPSQVAALLGTSVGFKASMLIAIPWIASLIGTYYIPHMSDRKQERRITSAITLLLAALGIGFSALFDGSPAMAIFALCFAAIGVIAVQPVFWTMPSMLLSGAALAGGIGFINMFGAFGSFIAPIIRVQAEKLLGNDHAGLYTLAAITIVGVVLILMLKHVSSPTPNHKSSTAPENMGVSQAHNA